jgi:hypothetical protein
LSADRQLEAERRHFGHDNSGQAQHDRCRICFELDLLTQRKDRWLVRRGRIFSGWSGYCKRGFAVLVEDGGVGGRVVAPLAARFLGALGP